MAFIDSTPHIPPSTGEGHTDPLKSPKKYGHPIEARVTKYRDRRHTNLLCSHLDSNSHPGGPLYLVDHSPMGIQTTNQGDTCGTGAYNLPEKKSVQSTPHARTNRQKILAMLQSTAFSGKISNKYRSTQSLPGELVGPPHPRLRWASV